MARHSEHRFSTGLFIASLLPDLLRATKGANPFGRNCQEYASKAVHHFSAHDITESSRRDVYGAACAMLALAPHAGQYAGAFASYASALVSFSYHSEYVTAQEQATQAVSLAKAANKQAKQAA